MDGALQAVEQAIIAHHHGRLRQGRLVDRVEGEFEGLRLSLLAGEGVLSGMRVFGNPPHTRMFLLFDGRTRALLALMDYGVLNSLRVGATAGVAARYLAPPGSKRLGLLGSGWQALPQVVALARAVPTLEHITVFSPTPAHREKFAESLSEVLGIAIQPVASAAEAILDADVVDLCAPGHFDVRAPLFEAGWVKHGALVISMAANQYPARVWPDGTDGRRHSGPQHGGQHVARHGHRRRCQPSSDGGRGSDLSPRGWHGAGPVRRHVGLRVGQSTRPRSAVRPVLMSLSLVCC